MLQILYNNSTCIKYISLCSKYSSCHFSHAHMFEAGRIGVLIKNILLKVDKRKCYRGQEKFMYCCFSELESLLIFSMMIFVCQPALPACQLAKLFASMTLYVPYKGRYRRRRIVFLSTNCSKSLLSCLLSGSSTLGC